MSARKPGTSEQRFYGGLRVRVGYDGRGREQRPGRIWIQAPRSAWIDGDGREPLGRGGWTLLKVVYDEATRKRMVQR